MHWVGFHFSSQVMSECSIFEKKYPFRKLLCLQQTVFHFLIFSQSLCHKILPNPFRSVNKFSLGSGILLKFYVGFPACICEKKKGFQTSPSSQ